MQWWIWLTLSCVRLFKLQPLTPAPRTRCNSCFLRGETIPLSRGGAECRWGSDQGLVCLELDSAVCSQGPGWRLTRSLCFICCLVHLKATSASTQTAQSHSVYVITDLFCFCRCWHDCSVENSPQSFGALTAPHSSHSYSVVGSVLIAELSNDFTLSWLCCTNTSDPVSQNNASFMSLFVLFLLSSSDQFSSGCSCYADIPWSFTTRPSYLSFPSAYLIIKWNAGYQRKKNTWKLNRNRVVDG